MKVSTQVDNFDVADVLSDFFSNIFSLKKDVQDRKDLHLSLCDILSYYFFAFMKKST